MAWWPQVRHPPGDEIYRNGNVCMFEVREGQAGVCASGRRRVPPSASAPPASGPPAPTPADTATTVAG